MARRKPTAVPEPSKIERGGTHAFARRSKAEGDDDEPEPIPMVVAADPAPATPATPTAPAALAAATPAPATAPAAPAATPAPAPAVASPAALAAAAAAHADADAERMHSETMVMPMSSANIGIAPDLPDGVEDPTNMPNARNIPSGNPNDPAKAPGHVPRGDSRSLRRGTEFALVYRVQTFVISRFGVVGTRGQWRVVEYPTSASASHSYARETSRYLTEGYSDYRD